MESSRRVDATVATLRGMRTLGVKIAFLQLLTVLAAVGLNGLMAALFATPMSQGIAFFLSLLVFSFVITTLYVGVLSRNLKNLATTATDITQGDLSTSVRFERPSRFPDFREPRRPIVGLLPTARARYVMAEM